jgi:hypothetical protein
MMAGFTGKLKMKSVGKPNGTPCGVNVFRRFYGNDTKGD